MKNFEWLSLAALVLSGAVQAASFDCAKAQSKVEKMICADAELSKLDEDMAQAYSAALKETDNAGVRQNQKQWAMQRNSCTEVACVKDAYVKRIAELSSDKPTGYRMLQGKGYTICEEMFKRLNEELARKPNGPVCGYDILRSIPGVAPPSWTQLDLKDHKELYKRYALARRLNDKDWEAGFSEPPPKAGQKLIASFMPTEEMLERDWQEAIQQKMEFYKWTDAWPAQEATDVMLIHIRPGTDKHCAYSSSILFEGDLRKPRTGFLWWLSMSNQLPFNFGGRHFQMWQSVHRTESDAWLISGELSINWISEDKRREPVQTNICHIRRNLSFEK